MITKNVAKKPVNKLTSLFKNNCYNILEIKMRTAKLQSQIDGLINDTCLWAVPTWLKPNFFTLIRLLLTPALYYLLAANKFRSAFFVFILAASTDFIDGALARTRNQITDPGKAIDPIADKLLIGTMLAMVAFQYTIVKVFLLIIGVEILAVLVSSFLAVEIGRPLGANVFGKIKMNIQSVCIGLFLMGIITENHVFIILAVYLLDAALCFALLSAYEQVMAKFDNLMKFLNLKKPIHTLASILRKM
jgi:CDP-diacylglycerol--glycerol-3-phosphate 3-phosphatidyltransferase